MSLSDVARHSARWIVTETYDEVGFNYRMTDMQAAMGITQLNRLDDLLARRRCLAARYTQALQDIDWLQTPMVPANCMPNYQSYMVRLTGDMADKRDAVMQILLEKNISTRRGIMAIHHEPPYRSERWNNRLLNTDLTTGTGLILPLFHQMTEAEQDYIIESLLAFRL